MSEKVNTLSIPADDLLPVYAFEKPSFAPRQCVTLKGDQPCDVLNSHHVARDRYVEPVGGQLNLNTPDVGNMAAGYSPAGKAIVRQELKNRAAEAAAGTCRFVCKVPECWRRIENSGQQG